MYCNFEWRKLCHWWLFKAKTGKSLSGEHQLNKKSNSDYRIKISKIINCKLTKIEELPFDFVNGACNTFSSFGILFCFAVNERTESKDCHSMMVSSNGTISIKKELSSNYGHERVSLGSYRDRPFVTGGYKQSKTEILNIDSWKSKSDFPFGSRLNSLWLFFEIHFK